MAGVLTGIRVLDIGRYVAGPYCATLLGYLGAEVVRVEPIGGADDRAIAPVTEDGTGAVFLQTGCNKRSICLDLRNAAAQAIRRRLIASADVVVSNSPPGVRKKNGFDIDALRQIRPDIILANATAFGDVGPLAERGGFDGIGQAMSGAMYMSGTPGKPVKAAAPYVDYTTAVLLAFGVMAALRERDLSGRGQEVSASLLSTALAVFNSHLIEQGVLGIDRIGSGNRVQTSAPSDVFPTRDGHILVHCPGDRIFARWAGLLDKGDWIDDPRFATDKLRGDHRDIVCAPMEAWCRNKTTDEALDALAQHGIPAGPVLSPREALEHPQVDALGVLGRIRYASEEIDAPVADIPLRFSLGEAGIRKSPPVVGDDTDEVLTGLGYSREEIAGFRASGAVA